jgi:hypothetical protein
VVGAVGPEPKAVELVMPQKLDNKTACTKGLRNILKKQGPQAFADVRGGVTLWSQFAEYAPPPTHPPTQGRPPKHQPHADRHYVA